MIEINLAKIEDATCIAEIEQISFLDAWSEKSILDCLNNQRYTFYVAKEQGKIIGYSGLLNCFDFADVTRIAVLPEFKNMGVGKKLFSALLNKAKELEVDSLMLEVRADNLPAISLYEKFGGVVYGVRKNYYGGGIDGILYRFTLGEEPLGI